MFYPGRCPELAYYALSGLRNPPFFRMCPDLLKILGDFRKRIYQDSNQFVVPPSGGSFKVQGTLIINRRTA